MVDSQQEQAKKLLESRAKLEAELERYQQQLLEVVDNAEKKYMLEVWLFRAKRQRPKHLANTNNSTLPQMKPLTPLHLKVIWKKGLSEVTVEKDDLWKDAREYFNGFPETEKASQSSDKNAPEAKSASQNFKALTSRISKTSS